MNRIVEKFSDLKSKKRKALIIYLTVGDPNLSTTEALVEALSQSGTDIVELGVPFSDPIADGPTIQAASQRALSKGISLRDALYLAKSIRNRIRMPLVLMGYYNPIYRMGVKKFAHTAKNSGVDGVIIPDLIPEEAHDWIEIAQGLELSTIFLSSPTTPPDRIRMIGKLSRGFLYYVSVCGVTGSRKSIPQNLIRELKIVKGLVDLPVACGFGISTPLQAREVSKWCDGIIIGSSFINKIRKGRNKSEIIKNARSFSSRIRNALDNKKSSE